MRCLSACYPDGKIPKNALASGLWVGDVPSVLSELRFVERLLIAKVQHNVCFVKVASGQRKLVSHVIAFESPVRKVYNRLPPPREDLDDVLAILFTGPVRPMKEQYLCTPLLVRHNAVIRALEWLKLNHIDYRDLEMVCSVIIRKMNLACLFSFKRVFATSDLSQPAFMISKKKKARRRVNVHLLYTL